MSRDQGEAEVLASGRDPDGRGGVHWALVAGGLAIALLVVGLLVRRTGAETAPVPVPSGSVTVASVPLSLTATRSYVRADATTHRVVAVVMLRNDDSAMIMLTAPTVTAATAPMWVTVVPVTTAQHLVLAAAMPEPDEARIPTGPDGIPVAVGEEVAAVVDMTPDCTPGSADPAAAVTLVGRALDRPVPGSRALSPRTAEQPFGFATWWQQARDEACGPGQGDVPADAVATRTLDGITVTTSGPSAPPGGELFTVTLAATNHGRRPWVGSIGVSFVDRVRVDAEGFPPVPTTLDLDPIEVRSGVQVGGGPSLPGPGVVPYASEVLFADQVLYPGRPTTVVFRLRATPDPALLGPTHGWVPVLRANDVADRTQPDAAGFPTLLLPPR